VDGSVSTAYRASRDAREVAHDSPRNLRTAPALHVRASPKRKARARGPGHAATKGHRVLPGLGLLPGHSADTGRAPRVRGQVHPSLAAAAARKRRGSPGPRGGRSLSGAVPPDRAGSRSCAQPARARASETSGANAPTGNTQRATNRPRPRQPTSPATLPKQASVKAVGWRSTPCTSPQAPCLNAVGRDADLRARDRSRDLCELAVDGLLSPPQVPSVVTRSPRRRARSGKSHGRMGRRT
jgi:hypothetical protein